MIFTESKGFTSTTADEVMSTNSQREHYLKQNAESRAKIEMLSNILQLVDQCLLLSILQFMLQAIQNVAKENTVYVMNG